MTRLALVIAGTGLVASWSLDAVDGACSTATPKQLTWSCGGVCEEYIPCLAFDASDCGDVNCTIAADQECAYQCITDFYYSDWYGEIMIPFGSYQSEEEIADREALGDEAYDAQFAMFSNDTDNYAWASNDDLDSIAAVEMNPNITRFYIVGGSSDSSSDIVRGKVANIALEGTFIAESTLQWVSLRNLNLKDVEDLSSLLPASVEYLYLRNNLIHDLPIDGASFPALQELYLSSNYLTTFSGSFPNFTWLDLDNNKLTELDGTFPALQYLYLANNSLTAIPDIIFNMSSLQQLYLTGNPFSGMPAFTRAQVTFLQNLTTLKLSAEDFVEIADCNGIRQEAVWNVNVCVTDEVSASSSSNGTLIAIIVSAVVVVGLIAATVWWMRSRRHSKDHTATGTANTDAPPWSDAELQRLRLDGGDLEDIRKLGSGSFGAVWLVRYRGNQLLASKRLLTSGRGGIGNSNSKQHQDASVRFVEEIKLVAQLEHPNIVTLVGVAWTYHSDIQALFEFMENGDLRDYLVKSHPSKSQPKKNSDESARLADEMFKLQIACDIVDALVYVHSFVPAIVHRDIKSRNVLLSSEWRAKLTDFGTARLQSENHTMTAEVGTGRWLAPEVLVGSKDYGSPADVYAFGVVLSELDTHAIPYDDARSNDGKKQLANVAIMQLVAEGKLRPTFSTQCRPELRALADRCMAQSPADRPVAAVLAYEVRKVMKLVQQESSREGDRDVA